MGGRGSVGVFITPQWIVGAEYRQKPDNLSVAEEDDWQSLYTAYFINKHVSLTGAWLDLGDIAGLPSQRGGYLSLQAAFKRGAMIYPRTRKHSPTRRCLIALTFIAVAFSLPGCAYQSATQSTNTTLYERLGGKTTIDAVVENLLYRIADDPEVVVFLLTRISIYLPNPWPASYAM
ncbi:hypothetical protein HORIV_29180 [Vreelandella olivaria]|uniref:Uncharacterized protein n=1 Tax=Vreelandella olivaria TaxID=390919 RepID=A0ABN5WX64_9GAMM|nr:hypothetical protein HORIV_29180 [Halomonas olivaria]